MTERKVAAGEKVRPEDLFDTMGKAYQIGGGDNNDDSENSVNETVFISISHLKRYNCGQLVHIAQTCPKKKHR